MYNFPMETLLETSHPVKIEEFDFEDRGKPKMLALLGISVYQQFEEGIKTAGSSVDYFFKGSNF